MVKAWPGNGPGGIGHYIGERFGVRRTKTEGEGPAVGSCEMERLLLFENTIMRHVPVRPAMLTLLLAATAACAPSELEQRQAEVAEAGAEVMPFDLDATTHVFEKTEAGGLQTVVADTDDAEQTALIRAHLAEEAERFSRGDFHDPEMIHGADMPGLHALMMGADRIAITYANVERGAEIRYETDDPALVAAIHEWFDAQVADHGEHAQGHM